MAQTYEEPKCRVTERPFYPEEKQISADTVGVYCSECGEELEVYSV